MRRAGPGRGESGQTVWVASARLNFNNAMPTTETDLQPSSVKRLSSHQMLAQLRSLHESSSDGRRRGKAVAPLFYTSRHIFTESVSSLLGFFSLPALSVLFLLLLLPHSPSVQNAILPTALPAFLLVCFSLQWEEISPVVAEDQASKPTVEFNNSVTHHSGFFPHHCFPFFFPPKCHWMLSLWLWKPTAAGRSEIIAAASVTDIIDSLVQ